MAFIIAAPLSARARTHRLALTPLTARRATPASAPRRARAAPPPRCAAGAPVPLTAGVGTSTAPDTATAVSEAVAAATASLGGPATAAIVTATVSHDVDNALPKLLADALPGAAVHGATTCAAALANTGPVRSPALSVLALRAPPRALAVARRARSDADAVKESATELVEALGAPPAHVLLHATPGTEEGVLAALAAVLPGVPVFGGSAADDAVAGGWRLLGGDGGVADGVSLLGIGTDVRFGAALVAPYEPGERGATVTRATGRTLHELDGRRAGDVLAEWVGEPIAPQARVGGSVLVECAAFPLGVRRAGADGWVGVHAAEIGSDGSVSLFAEVREGDRLTVMRNVGESDSAGAARAGLDMAYERACRAGGLVSPRAGLLIYCGGLSIAVGEQLAESLQGMKDRPPVLGITAFGEQGCLNGQNVHSNLAVGLALFE